MNVKRGEIYYADLSPVVGSEQGGAELTCQFCDRVHRFDAQELRGMIDDLKAQGK